MDALRRTPVAEDRPKPSIFTDGSVSSVAPLKVILDGIGEVTPDSLVDVAALSVGDRIRCEIAGRRQIVHGRAGGFLFTSPPNLCINGDFRLNQRGYVSGTDLIPGVLTGYGHDRWRTGEYMNLVSNSSFETDTAGWAAGNCTLARVNTWAADGSWSAQLSAPSSNDSFIGASVATIPGRTYTISATARLTAALTGTPSGRARAIYVYGAAAIAQSAALPNAAGEGRVSATFVAESATTTFRLYHGHTGGTIWWDALMVTEGAALRPFVRPYSQAARTSYTFAQKPNGCILTLNSGGTIQQVIERENMSAGEHTVSWAGTAQAAVYASDGSLIASSATSPLTFTNSGLGDRTIEFAAVGGSATLGEVSVIAGATAYPFHPRPIADELALAKRYYYRVAHPTGTGANKPILMVSFFTTTAVYGVLWHPVEMRATPIMRWSSSAAVSIYYASTATTAPAAFGLADATTARVGISTPTAGAANTGTWVELIGGQWFEGTAEF